MPQSRNQGTNKEFRMAGAWVLSGHSAGENSGVSRGQTAADCPGLYGVFGLHPSGNGEGGQDVKLAKGLH